MKKSYFLKYGCNLCKQEIKEILENKWEFDCTEHDSAYFGVYFKYSGLYADTLLIKDNNVSTPYHEWLDEDNKHFCTIVEVSITSGRNKDKLSKYKFLKSAFNSEVFSLISDKFLEE